MFSLNLNLWIEPPIAERHDVVVWEGMKNKYEKYLFFYSTRFLFLVERGKEYEYINAHATCIIKGTKEIL